jgi:predicted ester cyclase
MKLRSMAMVMMGVGALASAGACSKKPKEGKAPDIGSASNTMGSAGSGSAAAQPPKEARREGKAMAEHYLACTAHINGAKWDDFKTNCLAKDTATDADGQDLRAPTPHRLVQEPAHRAPDMKMQPQVVLVNGRNILAVGLITGTHTGVLKGPTGELPATNKKIGQLMFHRLTINDENRASQEWAYFDPATMAAQLGILPKDAPPLRAAMEKGMDGAPVIVVAADDDKGEEELEAATKVRRLASHKVVDIVATYTDDASSPIANDKDYKRRRSSRHRDAVRAFPTSR